MSNFEDYDLRHGEGTGHRRPANRPSGRPSGSRPNGGRPNGSRPVNRNGHSSRPSGYSNHSMDLDDEIELYEYDSQYGFEEDDMPARQAAMPVALESQHPNHLQKTAGMQEQQLLEAEQDA